MLTFGQGVMVLVEDGTLVYEDWQLDEGLRDGLNAAWGWVKSGAGKVADLAASIVSPLWDGFLNTTSEAELIAQFDSPDSVIEALEIKAAKAAAAVAKIQRSGYRKFAEGLGWAIAQTAIQIGRAVSWPSREFTAYINANPDAAGLIVLYGAISGFGAFAFGGGGAIAGIVPGVLALAAQMLIRHAQKDKPRRETGWRQFVTGAGSMFGKTTIADGYCWDDTGNPLDEGVMDMMKSAWAGLTSAWQFPPRMIRQWAEERDRAAKEERRPSIDTVEGLTHELADGLEKLPDVLAAAGIDTKSRWFQTGMTMSRAVKGTLEAILGPIWSVVSNALPGVADMSQRFEMGSLRIAGAGAAFLGILTMAGGLATPAFISAGIPLVALTLFFGAITTLFTNTVQELERQSKRPVKR